MAAEEHAALQARLQGLEQELRVAESNRQAQLAELESQLEGVRRNAARDQALASSQEAAELVALQRQLEQLNKAMETAKGEVSDRDQLRSDLERAQRSLQVRGGGWADAAAGSRLRPSPCAWCWNGRMLPRRQRSRCNRPSRSRKLWRRSRRSWKVAAQQPWICRRAWTLNVRCAPVPSSSRLSLLRS